MRISPEMRTESIAAARGLTPGQFWELPRAEQARMIAYHEIQWRVEALQRWEQREQQKREDLRKSQRKGLRR